MKNDDENPDISFAEFELDIPRRQLLRQGQPVSLHSRAFDLLVFLVENSGRVVSKEEILEKVWANRFVEEANLSVQISALRKALGETREEPQYLLTIPGVGYKFIGNLKTQDNEIIIEKHRIKRISVEENFVDTPGPLVFNGFSQNKGKQGGFYARI